MDNCVLEKQEEILPNTTNYKVNLCIEYVDKRGKKGKREREKNICSFKNGPHQVYLIPIFQDFHTLFFHLIQEGLFSYTKMINVF